MYIADRLNHRIRKVTVSTGIITTIAGTGTATYGGDGGPATSATLNFPIGVALDTSGIQYTNNSKHIFYLLSYIGNVFIGDQHNNRIRKVTVSTDIISTIAGSSTSGGYSGDGGAATSAMLHYPVGVALDSSGTPFTIVDSSSDYFHP